MLLRFVPHVCLRQINASLQDRILLNTNVLTAKFSCILGGGSALLPAPVPPVTLEEKETLTRLLASKGATIQELNTIRKALSLLKGGGLARAAYPAKVGMRK